MKHLPSAPILAAAAALTAVSSLAEKTTNTYTRAASDATPMAWATAGLPSTVTTTAGSDISIKIEYAEGAEKYQLLKTATMPIYLDSVIGGRFHEISFVNAGNNGRKYAVINDPTPFEGFWSLDASTAKATGIYLPDNDGAGPRTIRAALLRGRFEFGIATGCEAILDYPFGIGMFEVNRPSAYPESMSPASLDPKGKLTVNHSPGPYSVAQVRRGTLAIVGGEDDTSSPVPGAWARFDASAEDSFTFNGTAITEWRDADGRPVSAVKSGNSSPTLFTDPETGLKSVNFGAFRNYSGTTAGNAALHGAPSRLALSETRDDVAEMFVVFCDNVSGQGIWPSIAGDAFPRYVTPGKLFKEFKNLPAELAMGEIRLDGQAVMPDVACILTNRMHVVSAGYRSGGGTVGFLASPDNDGHNNVTMGGIKIAEILFYTHTLTSAERRHNNDYLMKKWFGRGVRDYGAIMLDRNATLSVDSGTARVRELNLAADSFAKNGAGTLEIESINTNVNTFAVNGGAVRFAGTLTHPENPQPLVDPLFWFDASESASFETFTSNYNGAAVTFVTSWKDKRNNGYTLARPLPVAHANYANGLDEAAYPTLDTSTGALPMVDLGPWVKPVNQNFGWIAGASGLSTWLCLYKSDGTQYGSATIRQGFVVFYKTDARGNPINSSGWSIRNTVAETAFAHDMYANPAATGGFWTYDGVTVCPSSVRGGVGADGRTHLGSFMFADAALPVNVFGADMSVGPGGGGNASGGCKIAEVILYDRYLSEQERLDTERYLMAKWNCGTHPADSVPSVTTLSFNNGTPAVIDTDASVTIGTVTGSGTVVKKGTGTATVGTFAQNVAALALEDGTLAVTGDMTIADNAVLDVYVDEEGPVGTASVTGQLTIGGTVTVRVHIPEGVTPEFGKYNLFTAGTVFGYHGGWPARVVEGEIRGGTASVSCDEGTGIIRLNINPNGILLIFQ